MRKLRDMISALDLVAIFNPFSRLRRVDNSCEATDSRGGESTLVA